MIIVIILIILLLFIYLNALDTISDSLLPYSGGAEITTAIILPCQLLAEIIPAKKYIIIEDPAYFDKLPFHKLKLVFTRATMKYYASYLSELGADITYIDFIDARDKYVSMGNISNITMYDPIDKNIELYNHKIKIKTLPSPYFLNTKADLANYKLDYAGYSHDKSFYPWMRRKYNVLMDGDDPLSFDNSRKWSFDKDNRNRFPEDIKEPWIGTIRSSSFIDEAREYIAKHFPNAPGSDDYFVYPSTHDEAAVHLDEFLTHHLKHFGKYQDAAAADIAFGYHSVISSSLNIGLLTPAVVLAAVRKIKVNKNNIASIEGFIRQIIGWREYCHLMYHYESENMRRANFYNAKKKLSSAWWDATTGLKPIDDIINRVRKYAYAHHIERLMYLAAPMMMIGIHPTEMYNWFMSFVAIDAYDWVMVPNIYGMGSFADGGVMMTRPYFSSSKYIEKMSNWGKIDLWNDLFYYFIGNNIPQMKANYYTARYINNYKNKTRVEKKRISTTVEKFIKITTK